MNGFSKDQDNESDLDGPVASGQRQLTDRFAAEDDEEAENNQN